VGGPDGRFVILTDEHVSLALVSALRRNGWTVVRVEDEPGLGKGTADSVLFAYATARGWALLSRDDKALVLPKQWQEAGRAFRGGMLHWAQRHDRRMSVGDVVRFIEALACEEDPFVAGVRHIKPE